MYHNITDFVNTSSDTNITLIGAMAGETYSITVIAVNVLGDGYSRDILINGKLEIFIYVSATLLNLHTVYWYLLKSSMDLIGSTIVLIQGSHISGS